MADGELDLGSAIRWGMIPLLGLVFAAGGAYYMLQQLDSRVLALEQTRASNAQVAELRRKAEAHEAEADRRHERTSRNVIAICVATEADCQ